MVLESRIKVSDSGVEVQIRKCVDGRMVDLAECLVEYRHGKVRLHAWDSLDMDECSTHDMYLIRNPPDALEIALRQVTEE